MSNKQILNVAISSPEESLAHFAKVWNSAAGRQESQALQRYRLREHRAVCGGTDSATLAAHQCAEEYRPHFDLRAGKEARAALQKCTHRRYRAGAVGHHRKGCRG